MAFSIVIPVWNKRDAVAATIASVLDQSWRDFELIIVDDGSTDGSMEAIEHFDDPRIRRIGQANAGAGAARNRGIEESRSDWIAFLDADDLWSPDHLAELDRLRVEYPQAGLIGTAYAGGPGDDGNLSLLPGDTSIGTIDYFTRRGRGEKLFCASSAAIPRRSYAELGGFLRCPTGEDSEYWARIALDRTVAFSGRATATYRKAKTGLSARAAATGRGTSLQHAGELAPVVALLMARYPAGTCPTMREAVDLYVDFRFSLCTRTAARIGDVQTLRSLPRLYLRPPPIQDRLILLSARMPRPLAYGIYRLGFGLRALNRRLKRSWRRFAKTPRTHAPSPTAFTPVPSQNGI
jgi:glycosyltransferase involved in cell wall biosynthesis